MREQTEPHRGSARDRLVGRLTEQAVARAILAPRGPAARAARLDEHDEWLDVLAARLADMEVIIARLEDELREVRAALAAASRRTDTP